MGSLFKLPCLQNHCAKCFRLEIFQSLLQDWCSSVGRERYNLRLPRGPSVWGFQRQPRAKAVVFVWNASRLGGGAPVTPVLQYHLEWLQLVPRFQLGNSDVLVLSMWSACWIAMFLNVTNPVATCNELRNLPIRNRVIGALREVNVWFPFLHTLGA